MSAASNDSDMNRSGEPDDLAAVDHALLLALTRIRHDSAPLSASQEQLLDDWLDGRLPATEAGRAVALIKQNGLAAEHVLERRLVAAANSGAEVPAALSARKFCARQSQSGAKRGRCLAFAGRC